MSAVLPSQPGLRPVDSHTPPRVLYGTVMLVVVGLSSAAAFAAARAAGGTESARLQIIALIAAPSLLGLLPVLVRSAERFGLAVLGASMARLLLTMFGAILLTEVGGIDNRPVWFGVLAGAGLGLIAETTLAVAVLSAMERRKRSMTTERDGAESRTTIGNGSENRAAILPEPSTTC